MLKIGKTRLNLENTGRPTGHTLDPTLTKSEALIGVTLSISCSRDRCLCHGFWEFVDIVEGNHTNSCWHAIDVQGLEILTHESAQHLRIRSLKCGPIITRQFNVFQDTAKNLRLPRNPSTDLSVIDPRLSLDNSTRFLKFSFSTLQHTLMFAN